MRFAAACLLVALLGLAPTATHAETSDPDRIRSLGMVSAYKGSEHWAVKAVALANLAPRWHPCAADIVLDGLVHKDRRLRAYALESLRVLRAKDLAVALTAPLAEALAEDVAGGRDKALKQRAHELLGRAFPDAEIKRPGGWKAFWRKTRATYAPRAWKDSAPPEEPEDDGKGKHGTVVRRSLLSRAVEISQTPLELVIVIDSTGSMQPAIDATRRGLVDLMSILDGMAEELRVGLVHYKDLGELGGSKGPGAGAKPIEPLSKDVRALERELGRIVASGGGDIPERVDAGLWHALQRDMRWRLEANKMVIVIGDAPPHGPTMEKMLALAKKAHASPAGLLRSKKRKPIVTGRRSEKPAPPPRPFVISAVAVGPDGAFPQTAEPFRKLAKAGGGVYAELATKGDPVAASNALVSRLVEMSFGAGYVDAARRFVAIFFDYANAGYRMR